MVSGGSATCTALTTSGTGEVGSVASRASASKRTRTRDPSCDDRVRRCRQDVEGHPRNRAERLEARRDARHAQVADDDEPRRPAQLETGAERRRERARHEVDGHEPAAAFFDRRRRQRDDAASGRCERLPGGQGDRLRFGRDGQPAGERVFTGGEIEQPGQVVQREHLLAVQQAYGQRTPRALRQHGERSRGRRLSRQREREKDGETNRQGADCREASQRQNASIIPIRLAVTSGSLRAGLSTPWAFRSESTSGFAVGVPISVGRPLMTASGTPSRPTLSRTAGRRRPSRTCSTGSGSPAHSASGRSPSGARRSADSESS